MKRSVLFALLVLLLCAPVFASSAKAKFEVKASGGTTKAEAGDGLELTLNRNSIIVVDKNVCANGVNKEMHCYDGDPGVSILQIPPSAITEIVAGHAARFVCISWAAGGQKARLAFQTSEQDFPLIVGFLDDAASKKAINVDTQTNDRPRVFLRSQSFGNRWSAVRDQSMEMAKDFGNICPAVQITMNEEKADFTVGLNHIEVGLLGRDNQVQVYDKDGDLISGKEGGSILNGVKNACVLIVVSWADHWQ
jgi:hypothetical protein